MGELCRFQLPCAMPANAPLTIGFLSVDHDEDYGFLGGYLILNDWGRPQEFHCTTPVKPTRAHEILYGTELKPYLYGEQIGCTLLQAAKSAPAFVCVDSSAALAVREHATLPVALVMEPDASAEETHATFSVGEFQLAMPRRYAAEQGQIRNLWQGIDNAYDLLEPFHRIRQALEEAKRSMRGAA